MSQVQVSKLAGVATTLGQITISPGHTLNVEGQLKFNSTGAHALPAGTQAQRPATPQIGDTRLNTDTNSFEIYTGGFWKTLGAAGIGGATVGDFATPAANGIAVKLANRPSGYYWIQPIGYETPTYCYVDNDNYDGGWVLVMTAGRNTNNHYGTFEASSLYSGNVGGQNATWVPFSGTGYDANSGRKQADTFIRAVAEARNGGDEVINVRIARNGANPPGGVYDTYNGGTTTNWRYASFIKYRGGIQYYSNLNTGGDARQGDRREGNFRVSHVYPYNWEQPGGWEHIRLYDNNYKIFDYHSNPSNLQTSRYSNNRVLWGYQSRNGVYGGSASFNGSGDSNEGYFFVR